MKLTSDWTFVKEHEATKRKLYKKKYLYQWFTESGDSVTHFCIGDEVIFDITAQASKYSLFSRLLRECRRHGFSSIYGKVISAKGLLVTVEFQTNLGPAVTVDFTQYGFAEEFPELGVCLKMYEPSNSNFECQQLDDVDEDTAPEIDPTEANIRRNMINYIKSKLNVSSDSFREQTYKLVFDRFKPNFQKLLDLYSILEIETTLISKNCRVYKTVKDPLTGIESKDYVTDLEELLEELSKI